MIIDYVCTYTMSVLVSHYTIAYFFKLETITSHHKKLRSLLRKYKMELISI